MKFLNFCKKLLNSKRGLERSDAPRDFASDSLGNITIINNQVFVDGKELESQSTRNISVTVRKGKVLVNGKEPKYKNS